MPCERIGNAIICYNNMYRYYYKGKSYVFEWHNYCGPTPMTCKSRRSGWEPMQRIPAKFWDAVTEFANLSDEEKEKYLFNG